MKLADWMARQGLEDAALADAIGVMRTTINRLRRGKSQPSRDVARAIFSLSDGLVTPNDFYGLGEAPEGGDRDHPAPVLSSGPLGGCGNVRRPPVT
jgi:transcriptional regulator with XRE-family HTH domain